MRDSFPPVQVGMDSMPVYTRIIRLSSVQPRLTSLFFLAEY